ncbi:MAG: HEPN domain-containing protein [Deltaproteobacteria bacterium]|nr:HEPN domain-containing protein [Deltaproteobacteria bacterium]
MPPSSAKKYIEWFAKAGEDELSIRAIFKGGSPGTACFLAQQMFEKYLKGLAVFHNKRFLKVHDLLTLETILLDVEPDVTDLHNDLKHLNRYYIETRYPGDYPQFTEKEAHTAYEAAERVKNFVMQKVKSK